MTSLGARLAARARLRASAPPALVLVLGAILSVQLGSAIATGIVRQVGPVITVTIRLCVAALVLVAVARPSPRGRSRRDWLAVGALGTSLAAMNLCFYGAIGRLPLGVVVTIEFLGPLGLAALASRRLADLVAVAVALAGVVAVSGLAGADLARLDGVGLVLAVGAGIGWAAYIVAARAVGARWRQLDGLALSMLVAAVLVAPLGFVEAARTSVTPAVLTAGIAVGLLSSVVPYSLEMLALRRLDTRVFGILMSVEPAVAALAGLVVLGQTLTLLEVGGMAAVVAASAMVMVAQRPTADTKVAEIGG